MKKLLEFLFEGCWHLWEKVEEQETIHREYHEYSDKPINQYNVKTYILQCKKCGEMHNYKVSFK